MIDAIIGGALMSKTLEATCVLMEELAFNNYQWTYEKNKPKQVHFRIRLSE